LNRESYITKHIIGRKQKYQGTSVYIYIYIPRNSTYETIKDAIRQLRNVRQGIPRLNREPYITKHIIGGKQKDQGTSVYIYIKKFNIRDNNIRIKAAIRQLSNVQQGIPRSHRRYNRHTVNTPTITTTRCNKVEVLRNLLHFKTK
jgi:hypothetical protein